MTGAEFRRYDRVAHLADLGRYGTVTHVLSDGSPQVRFDEHGCDTLLTPDQVVLVQPAGGPR